MAMSFRCPECGRQYAFKPELAGKRGKCAQCGHSFVISGPESAPPNAIPTARPLVAEPRPLVGDDFGASRPAVAPAPAGGGDLDWMDSLSPAIAPPPLPDATPGGAADFRPPALPRPMLAGPAGPDWRFIKPGLWLAGFGAVGTVLPLFGVQFRLLMIFGGAAEIIGLLLVLGGAAAVFVGLRSSPGVGIAAAGGIGVVGLAVFASTWAWVPRGLGNFTQALIAELNDLSTALGRVHDAKSARSERANIDNVVSRIDKIIHDNAKLKMTEAEAQRWERQYGAELQRASERMKEEAGRISKIPEVGGVAGVLGPSLMRLDAILTFAGTGAPSPPPPPVPRERHWQDPFHTRH